MPRKNLFLVILIVLLRFSRADAVSIEEFKKMNPQERDKALAEAPPGQKEVLMKVERHLYLLLRFGSEDAIKANRESTAAGMRGVLPIEHVFTTQLHLWHLYVLIFRAGVSDENGVTSHENEQEISALERKVKSLQDRIPTIHSLVFNVAASPEALELAKRAANLSKKWRDETRTNTNVQPPSVSREVLAKVDAEADQIFTELKTLPSLSAAEAQKEYDATTEDKLYGR